MHWIDITIVILFLIGVLLFGTTFRRYVDSSHDYFLAAKMLPWWAIGMSIVVADIGATEYIGMSGGAYRFGLAQANFDWLGCAPAMILGALIFIPLYWKMGIYTVPEYLGKRYSQAVRGIEAALWVILLACLLGIILWASGLVLQTLLGWPMMLSIIVTAAVVGVYTVSGGLAAVVMTNALQFVLLMIGATAILVLGLIQVGGVGEMVERVTSLGPAYKDHFKLFLQLNTKTPYAWPAIIFGLMMVQSPAYWLGNQAIIQSALGSRNEWDAKAGVMWAAFIKLFLPFLIAVPGLIALALYPSLTDGDLALPTLILNILPAGLKGLVFAAFFAALMSTVACYIESAATMFTSDLYRRFIKKNAPDKHYLFVGRVLTATLMLWGILFAPFSAKFPGIFVALQTLMSLILPPTFALLVLGILWRRITRPSGLIGLLSGVIGWTLMFIFKDQLFAVGDPFLYMAWWSFVLTSVVTIIVSLLTQPESEESLAGLVFGVKRSSLQADTGVES
ncbi:sodium/solute symporter [candidate division KSB1 bacterium]